MLAKDSKHNGSDKLERASREVEKFGKAKKLDISTELLSEGTQLSGISFTKGSPP